MHDCAPASGLGLDECALGGSAHRSHEDERLGDSAPAVGHSSTLKGAVSVHFCAGNRLGLAVLHQRTVFLQLAHLAVPDGIKADAFGAAALTYSADLATSDAWVMCQGAYTEASQARQR